MPLAHECNFLISLQVTSVTAIHVNHMYNSFLAFNIGSCVLSDSAVWTINVVTILISIPLLNQVVYPCLREYTPSMLKRIGLSYILAISSVFILYVMEWAGHHQSGLSANEEETCMFISSEQSNDTLGMNSWWMMLPYTAINLTEVFIFVSCKLTGIVLLWLLPMIANNGIFALLLTKAVISVSTLNIQTMEEMTFELMHTSLRPTLQAWSFCMPNLRTG